MCQRIHRRKGLRAFIAAMTIATALSLFFMPDTGFARRGGDDNRNRFYGIVESMPANGFNGEWVVGGRTVTTGPATEFDQTEGRLVVGGCAKVDIRNGAVHEIDSEPMRNCR